jgi:hypothetical protein
MLEKLHQPFVRRPIAKWLKAGVSEECKWSETKVGTPQGAVVSPLLANVYLHYVFDLWVEVWREKVARGDMIVVRYADDLVAGFQHRDDADRFIREFQSRLAKFELEVHSEKTRLIEFGRFAQANRRKRGKGKAETFTFLGFTHYCGRNSSGHFAIWRRTAAKRMKAKLQIRAIIYLTKLGISGIIDSWKPPNPRPYKKQSSTSRIPRIAARTW